MNIQLCYEKVKQLLQSFDFSGARIIEFFHEGDGLLAGHFAITADFAFAFEEKDGFQIFQNGFLLLALRFADLPADVEREGGKSVVFGKDEFLGFSFGHVVFLAANQIQQLDALKLYVVLTRELKSQLIGFVRLSGLPVAR